jgi:hypothetical protein
MMLEDLLEACQMEQFTSKGRTRYGHLLVNIEPTEYGCRCGEKSYDFSFDSNGDISVNVRKWPRRKIKDMYLLGEKDWKGFLICGKTGNLKRSPRPQNWEPKDKFTMARELYDALVAHVEGLS